MTPNNSKSYLILINNQINKVIRILILLIKINADSVLTEKSKSSIKVSKFKVNDRVRITKYNNIFSKGYTEIWS